MYKLTLFILAAVFAVALAEGQFYIPRAYYTIDAEGHESAHVPLRRLRRSLQPYPYQSGAKANADMHAADENSVNANAASRAKGSGNWQLPIASQSLTKPGLISLHGQIIKKAESPPSSPISVSTSMGIGILGASFAQSFTAAKEI